MKEEEILFREEQKMKQWWLWIMLILLLALPIYGLIQQMIFKIPFGNNPAPDFVLILIISLMGLLCYFFFSIRLITTINKDSIHIKYSILANKKVKWQDAKSAELIEYGFVGYGVRWSFKYGTVYNTSGNKGLLIHSKYGKFVVGTQKPEELNSIVSKLLPKY